MKKKKTGGWIPVVLVSTYMGLAYYWTIFIFMEQQQQWFSLNALVFTFCCCMCVLSFVACVVTDPGHVPSSFLPEIEQPSNTNVVNYGYCDKCSTYKPPRAHHCRVCKRCVLRMDHHCLWINNCVGFSNYKPFIIFILYAAISCIYSTVVITNSALRKDWEVNVFRYLNYLYITCGTITAVLSLTLGSLLVWHLYLLAHNMTTIEYHGGVRAKWLARKSGETHHRPFDLGISKNINTILGPSKLKWLCPTAIDHLRDGLSFPTSRALQ